MSYPHNLDGIQSPKEFLSQDLVLIDDEISFFLKKKEVKPGFYTDSKAVEISDEIFKFFQSKLETELNQLVFTDSLIQIYRELENIEAYRIVERDKIVLSAKGQITPDILNRIGEVSKKASELSLSVRHLLETLVRLSPQGINPLSPEKYLYLLALSNVIISIIFFRSCCHHDLIRAEFRVKSDLSFELHLQEQDFDMKGYYEKLSSEQFNWADQSDEQIKLENKSKITSDLDKVCKRMDPLFLEEFGFDLSSMIAVFRELTLFPVPKNSEAKPLVVISEGDLIKILHAIAKVEQNVIKPVLDLLSLSPALLQKMEVEPWLIRGRNSRITVRPLVQITVSAEDFFIFGNWTARSSFGIWISNLLRGRIPFSTKFIKLEPFKDELTELRLQNADQFERKVLKEAGKYFWRPKPQKIKRPLRRFNLDQNTPEPGEIDALCIDKKSKTIFVFDAKDQTPGLTPREIFDELSEYYIRKGGQVKKLQKKIAFFKDHKTDVLQHFRISDSDDWQVLGAFVVEGLRSSVFVDKRNFPSADKVPIIPLFKLGEYIQETRKKRSQY